jgi:predicted ester cyclase
MRLVTCWPVRAAREHAQHPVLRRRQAGDDHVVDETILHATAKGMVFGLEGRRRPVQARFLHIFDFTDGLISRESAWIELAAIQNQLSD